MSSAPSGATRKRAGFTLLELLVVLGLVAALAGISLGFARRALEAGKAARARSELGALAVALERFRSTYGDYPPTADADRLLQSLMGRRDASNAAIIARPCIELEGFSTNGDRDPATDATTVLIDPWGRPYVYAYKVPAAGWLGPGFVLYSTGPDGRDAALLPGGMIDFSASSNLDNIYANQH